MRLGLMQGRLLPPVDGNIQCYPGSRWADEFSLAASLGLDFIEWIVDQAPDNPLAGDAVAPVKSVIVDTGVVVSSICADVFMGNLQLAHGSPNSQAASAAHLTALLHTAAAVGATRIVLPFVDSSELSQDADLDAAKGAIEGVLPAARAEGVELHLETSLDPKGFAALLNDLPDPMVKVNYDMGNSAALGYRPKDEFAAYGARIGSVHVKDRVRGGTTVAPGTGSTEFEAVFAGLDDLGYDGDYVLQVARGDAGDEVTTIRHSIDFVHRHLNSVAG
jgi:L-ribulose-5-phosphate 3-epimerase